MGAKASKAKQAKDRQGKLDRLDVRVRVMVRVRVRVRTLLAP